MFFVIPRLILLKCDFMHEQESRDFGQRLNAQLTEELIQESSGFFLLSSFSSIYGWIEKTRKTCKRDSRGT